MSPPHFRSVEDCTSVRQTPRRWVRQRLDSLTIKNTLGFISSQPIDAVKSLAQGEGREDGPFGYCGQLSHVP
jgi:hypothetical protein